MRKLTLEELAMIAESRGGKCLTDTYVNCFEPMKWQCQFGHTWVTPGSNIKQGRWCHVCYRIESGRARQKYTIDDARVYAEQHGGQCLSEKVVSVRDRLQWKCSRDHIWIAKLHDMIRKRKGNTAAQWCPKCRIIDRAYSLDEVKQIAIERGGKCLSEIYNGCDSHLEWECEEGHQWFATLNNIKNNGSWCPECSTSRGERAFRKAIEMATGKPFPKKKPRWLLDDQGCRLELDGYNEDLKVAFEFQGRQHSEYIPYMHKTIDRFEQIKRRDQIKDTLCQQRGIRLLTPTSRMNSSEYENFVIENLKGVI